MYKCASFFAGVGGIDFGFEQAGFQIVYANEFDKNACITYNCNHKIQADCRDIRDVAASEIPNFDIMLAGFPCQPFSIAGNREGFEDKKDRGNLFFELIRIAKEKRPSVIFLENVANIQNHDNGNTLSTILRTLAEIGYVTKFTILSTDTYGNLPQNRKRAYFVAFASDIVSDRFCFPYPIPLTLTVQDIVVDKKVADKYYYTDNFMYYDVLQHEITNPGTVYQWRRKYVRENKQNLCPTLTANMGTGGHNVPIVLTKHGIRKLTPAECFAFQGFPKTFCLPSTVADGQLWKQAGNAVSVPVIYRIATNIMQVLDKREQHCNTFCD
jgi:DNA (cytosine-5)-methyltransferase 1